MYKNKKIVLCLVAGFFILSTTYAQEYPIKADVYVATDGNDSYPGTIDKPFATLKHAQLTVQKKIAAGLQSNITVLIRQGNYVLKTPLVFTILDSGTVDHSITFAAYPGEKVILSGATSISGWKKNDNNIWTTHLSDVIAGKWSFRELYAGNRHLTRARYPNADTITVTTVGKNNDSNFIQLDMPYPAGNLAGKDAELVVYHLWCTSRALIESSNGTELHLANPVGWIGHSATTLEKGRQCYLENALEFLDQPGEWYLDNKTGTLYYQADKNENPNEMNIIAPLENAEQLIVIQGLKGSTVRNIHIKHINFEYSWWQLPKQGYNDIWAGHYGSKYIDEPTYTLPSAIHLTYCEDCSFEMCRVAHTGSNGISFGAGSCRNKIVGCEFYDTGANAIYVGWRPKFTDPPRRWIENDWKDPSDAPSSNEISNNYIHGCCTIHLGCVGTSTPRER